ncbi:XkdX family protein [Schleiferilactobacillus harbinensis]|uniref:XkdX family protein n=1 Tax=Schleiferilactobacillus harbinensis TaxID=304207 RepID=A0A5P8M9N4_9LACO|nr:XkdX family protein [Schleiferilactobacillus harbinensis]
MYYKMGLFTNQDMQLFVQAGEITADQYKQATGEDYVAPAA